MNLEREVESGAYQVPGTHESINTYTMSRNTQTTVNGAILTKLPTKLPTSRPPSTKPEVLSSKTDS